MQWILQRFEDTGKLGEALDQLGISYTWHKVVPFVGDLVPEPVVADPDRVVLFGSYSLWRYAGTKGYRPGVFKLRPFVHEQAWHPFLLNGADALFLTLQEVPEKLAVEERRWFVRPVGDSKEEPGNVKTSSELVHPADTGRIRQLEGAGGQRRQAGAFLLDYRWVRIAGRCLAGFEVG
jgi:hypothetical protein